MSKKIQYSDAKARAKAKTSESGFDSTHIRVPKGVGVIFSFKEEGVRRFDVLPYKVGRGNRWADPGTYHYERTYYVHKNIGPEEKTYCCLKKTFGKQCPVCDHMMKLKKEGAGKEEWKAFKWSERQLFNVIDVTTKEDRDKGVQVLDQSTFLFGDLIDAKIESADPDDGYENFFHLEGGKTLKLGIEKASFNGNTFYKVSDLEMKNREDYEESVLEETHCLDDLLYELSYQDLKRIFEGNVGAESEEEETTSRGSPSRTRKDDSDDDDEEEEEESPPARSSRRDSGRDSREEEEDRPARRGRVTEEDEDGDRDEEETNSRSRYSRR